MRGFGKLNRRKLEYFLGFALLFLLSACTNEQISVDERLSTPEKTYRLWFQASEKEDIPQSMEYLTAPSKRIMEAQLRDMDVLIARMRANIGVFRTYTIVEQKLKEDRAVILLKGQGGDIIPVPMKKEPDGWKVDLVALFGGAS